MSRAWKIGFMSLAALGVLTLGYLLRSREIVPPSITGVGNNGGGILTGGGLNNPSDGSLGSVEPIFTEPVLAYFAGENGIRAANKDGHIISRFGDTVEIIASSSFHMVSGASFSFDGKLVLLETGGKTSPMYRVFDIDKKAWKDLPQMHSPAWAPRTREIMYLDKKSSGYTLNSLSADSPTPRGRVIMQSGVEDATLFWARTNIVFLIERGGSFTRSSAWRVDTQRKTWQTVALDKYGLNIRWNGDGTAGLALTTTGRGGQLTLIGENGEARRALTILTLPDKCLLESGSLTCAVPQDRRSLETSFLPDDYLKESLFTRDSFIKIDLDSGNVDSVFQPTAGFDAINLQLRDQNLFFINRLDGRLYSLPR